MAKLEEIKLGQLVRGIAPNQTVSIVSATLVGTEALDVVYSDNNNNHEVRTIFRDEESNLEIVSQSDSRDFSAEGHIIRLVTEANRIKLAHQFDPYLAIHTSLIDPLPHQISAVYGEMLPRQPLRYLLADDPGAGKTIMAGLLMKELIARSDLERCLVIAPGALVEQWQDELTEKFNLEFQILTREMIENSSSGNPFDDYDQIIIRLDVLARNEALQKKLDNSQEWDLIVCDEAHRMSATYYPGEISYTKRYRVGQLAGKISRHLLLMTATPHNGKEEDFQLFMALLDSDRFEGGFREDADSSNTKDLMRRLTKEKLLRFDGRPLFPERCANTVKYKLSEQEAKLYNEITTYVQNEMNRVKRFGIDGKKTVNVGFALQILQRRLASSPEAIYQSLKRRRERLECELIELTNLKRTEFSEKDLSKVISKNNNLLDVEEEDFDEMQQEDVEKIEEFAVTNVTAAENLQQLELEIETLKNLEQLSQTVLFSGEDTKWRELDQILDVELNNDSAGNVRKLIVFTEAKDTLNYLHKKIRVRLGNSKSVDVIHGGIQRDDRREIINKFTHDSDLRVLIATDAAGEGVNLQRGHLMVNYDLPWNPNKIEQRFGRIHRIGQTEVCHLWNLVAEDTREGVVFSRLLDKLDSAREALGGQVYDVIGELFEGVALKDLLLEAIKYGDRAEVRERLNKRVDGVVNHKHLYDLLNRRALTKETLSKDEVEELRINMERAEARRLQPHHIQSFFIEAFEFLGGDIRPREKGRWEIINVPLIIRSHEMSNNKKIQKKYERICFEKNNINVHPVATFVCPGHPLLEALIEIILEKYSQHLQQGSMMVDETDEGSNINAIYLLEHSVKDGYRTSTGKPHIISKMLQFASINEKYEVNNAGIAPHLNLRPASIDEVTKIKMVLNNSWYNDDLEKPVRNFATTDLAQKHVTEVKMRRLPEIDKIEQEVKIRLKREITFWNKRALELKEKEKQGEKTRLPSQNILRRAENLAERLELRMARLSEERFITSIPPIIRGGMIVIPAGLLRQFENSNNSDETIISSNIDARLLIEKSAMDAVMKKERELGNIPKDVSIQKIGYDIESFDPDKKSLRFIEVKGRKKGADSILITRQELITSLHEPEKFILAIVFVENGIAEQPHYVLGTLDDREPRFEQSAIQYKISKLLNR